MFQFCIPGLNEFAVVFAIGEILGEKPVGGIELVQFSLVLGFVFLLGFCKFDAPNIISNRFQPLVRFPGLRELPQVFHLCGLGIQPIFLACLSEGKENGRTEFVQPGEGIFDFVRGITERKWVRSKSEKRKQISQKKTLAGCCIQIGRDWSCHMKYVVEQNLSMWIRYSIYEIRICQGIEYIIPAQDAYPRPYNMQKKKEELVLDSVNVGLLVLGKKSEQVIQESVLKFVEKYGLLGMMTALPVTPDFMEFPETNFPKNRFTREKGLLTEVYMKKFFPFHEVEQVKKKLKPNWDDPEHTAFWSLLNGISDQPDAVRMSLQKEYAEPYEWVVNQLKDWAYMLSTTYLYYADGVVTDMEMNLTLQMGMEAFGGVAPSYIILLR